MYRRAAGGRHVVRIDDVFHADRKPVQSPGRPGFARAVARARLGERALGIEVGERPHDGIARGDAVEAGAGQRLGTEATGRHRRQRFERIELVRGARHRWDP
jgi:hypothetical protein